jgi:hypothetical protein
MVPFNARVYQAELRGFLVDLFNKGYKVVLWEEDGEHQSLAWLAQMDGIYDIMIADNEAKTEPAFVIVGRGRFAELEYIKRAEAGGEAV